MVWAQSMIDRNSKEDPTWYGTRREKERQAEKEMGSQHVSESTRLRPGGALPKAYSSGKSTCRNGQA